ncbi:MFS transporter [Sphingomonas sp. GB1N7]|uniref:MFS transporter n=1 Tax=Parasphingomonas caseinilytica TaxID=3096158 RepID=UPI002FC73495
MTALAKGSAGYRRLTLAMLFAGFSTFSLLYAAQPLLPVFATDFGLSAEGASLAIGLATGPLAIGILFAGALSDRWGRRPMMVAAMFVAGLLGLATAVAPNWPMLLAIRFATGVALAGVPAVAMAYVSEEVDHASVGSAMGLYIAGSAIGGMVGRLGVSLLTDLAGWRWAMAAVGLASLVMAEAFRRLAPESRGFVASAPSPAHVARGMIALFRDRAMLLLFAEAFLLMGVFVSIYNYAGFRLMGAPYGLGHAAVGAIFLLYVLGSVSSAWFGGLAGTMGRRKIFWVPVVLLIAGVALTAARPLAVVIAGIGIVTIGFFGAHSIASAWVGRRASSRRGQAAAVYLFFYYGGSSVLGSLGGMAWTRSGWSAVAWYCGVLGVIALVLGLVLRTIPPLPENEVPPVKPLGTD